MLYKCKNDRLYIIDVCCSMHIIAEVRVDYSLCPTQAKVASVAQLVRAPGAKPGGSGFKSHLKQLFALTLELLIRLYIEYIGICMVEEILPLIHILTASPRKFSYKVVCMLYKCKE